MYTWYFRKKSLTFQPDAAGCMHVWGQWQHPSCTIPPHMWFLSTGKFDEDKKQLHVNFDDWTHELAPQATLVFRRLLGDKSSSAKAAAALQGYRNGKFVQWVM